MALLYADTSAVVGAYFTDEPDHRSLGRILLTGDDPVLISEVTRVEFASAVAAARRGHRLDDPDSTLADFEANCADGGEFQVIDLDRKAVLPMAYQLVTEHPLRAMDAIHLATALIDARAFARGEEVAMVTRDVRQATAAKACGLRVL